MQVLEYTPIVDHSCTVSDDDDDDDDDDDVQWFNVHLKAD